MSDSATPWTVQHTRLPCPSLSPGVCWNSCPLIWRCHPTISSSVIPFSSCPQSFSVSRSFPVSQLFTWGGQIIGASASASVLPMYIRLISFRIDRFDLLAVHGTLKSLLQHHSLSVLIPQFTHPQPLPHVSKYLQLCLYSCPENRFIFLRHEVSSRAHSGKGPFFPP